MVGRKWVNSLVIGLSFLISNNSWAIDWGTEFLPWVGNYLEFEWHQSLIYQSYPGINTSRFHSGGSDNIFLTANLSNTILPEFSVAIESTLARTKKQKGSLDHIRLQGRYMWLDDIAGDSISLTTGLNFTQAFNHSVRDISSFHHGKNEVELFLSIGKEQSQGIVWSKRWWAVLGLGTAINRGSPWIRAQLAYEQRVGQNHEGRLFVHSLWGLGQHRICPHDFNGYGTIQHQSIDLGGRYTYLIEFVGSLSFEYSYRLYARNFPARAQCGLIHFFYPFGIY